MKKHYGIKVFLQQKAMRRLIFLEHSYVKKHALVFSRNSKEKKLMMKHKFRRKRGPVNRVELNDCFCKYAAPFTTLRTFPGSFALTTGRCGRHQSRCDRFTGSTTLTYHSPILPQLSPRSGFGASVLYSDVFLAT